MKKKNFITITKCPLTSCYVEEGKQGFTLDSTFCYGLAFSLMAASRYADKASFYNRWGSKTCEEQRKWIDRLRELRSFARRYE